MSDYYRINPSRRRRTLALFVFILFTFAMLGGCTNGVVPDDETENGTGNGTASGVQSPVMFRFLVESPITEVPVEEQIDNSYYRPITISGLKDQGVQQKINDVLSKSFETMREGEIPPYRGIKKLIPSGSVMIWEHVSMNIHGSFNNVLSVVLNKYTTYAVPDSSGTIVEVNPGEYKDIQSFSSVEGLNFNLNTGELITLEEVFTDDADYPEVLNQIIMTQLLEAQASEEGYFAMAIYDLKQVKPFTGIVENQAFFIDNFGLSIVFDHRTPEFETNRQALTIQIPWTDWSGVVAITERYYDSNKNLFTSEEPAVKILLAGNEKIDSQEQSTQKVGMVNIYSSTSYSTDYPKKVQDKVMELQARDENEIQRMNQAIGLVSRESMNQYGEGYYEQRVSTNSAGRFISITKDVFTSRPTKDYGDVQQWREHYCYDKNTGEEIQYNKIFIDGYDPSIVVKKALKTRMESDLTTYVAGGQLRLEEKEVFLGDEYIDRLYSNIQGIALYTASLDISFPSILIGQNQYMLILSIPYKDFGSDNLAIF